MTKISPRPRGNKFTMLLSEDEHAQLYELATGDGVPASVYLRTLIRNVHHDKLASKGKLRAKK